MVRAGVDNRSDTANMTVRTYITAPGIYVNKHRAVSMKTIIELTAQYLSLSPEKIISKKRVQDLVTARIFIMYIARVKLRFTLKVIGEALGRDHTTVIHSLRTLEDLCFSDPDFKYNFEQYKLFMLDKI
jgi:chromosomal replication initiator protein